MLTFCLFSPSIDFLELSVLLSIWNWRVLYLTPRFNWTGMQPRTSSRRDHHWPGKAGLKGWEHPSHRRNNVPFMCILASNYLEWRHHRSLSRLYSLLFSLLRFLLLFLSLLFSFLPFSLSLSLSLSFRFFFALSFFREMPRNLAIGQVPELEYFCVSLLDISPIIYCRYTTWSSFFEVIT